MSLEVSTQVTGSYTQEQLTLIKNMACQGASNDEFKVFIEVCQRLQLNPFIKQVYSIKRGNQRTIQISIDGYRAVAERTGRYAPGKEPSFEYTDDKKLESATAYIMKMTADGKWHEVAAKAHYLEYRANTDIWTKMPRAMLAKCAESLALRKAFPAEFSGTYTEDEMEQADKPVTVEVQTEKVITQDDVTKNYEKLRESLPGAYEGLKPYFKDMGEAFKVRYGDKWAPKMNDEILARINNVDKFKLELAKWVEERNKATAEKEGLPF